MAGRYVFGDWGLFGSPSGRLFYLDAGAVVRELRIGLEDRPLGLYLKAFGEDASGELYLFASRPQGPSGIGGVMMKIVPPPAAPLAITAVQTVNDTDYQATIEGGVGPFALQRKTRLEQPVWANEAFGTGPLAAVPLRGREGFFRAIDASQQRAVPFTALLSGAHEWPTPVTTEGQGLGMLKLEGNALTFTISYRGLSGPATVAHIHGPAPAEGAGGVLINLQPYHHGPFDTGGSFSGTVVLTDVQRSHLLGGQTYVNVHTAAHQDGEIRGQIAPVLMHASLLGESERETVDTPAHGFGTFALVGDRLTFTLAYSNLSGPATMAHIHGPAAVGQYGDVLINLGPFNGGAYGRTGRVSGAVVLTPPQLAWVIDGKTYVNFHTAAHAGGEIRGQILPQSTAVPLTAWISGLNERPAPLANSAGGLGLFALEGSTLSFNVAYNGLSGPATRAHIHGPATAAESTGVQINLAPFHVGPLDVSGIFSGAVTLTPAQRTMVLSGLSYVNVHTDDKPDGETRGQIAPVLMSAGLSGPSERPTSIVSTGSAIGLFGLVGADLTFDLVYTGLSGAATAAHIHAPASVSQTANPVLDFAPYNGGAYGVAGALTGTTTLAADVLAYLVDGLGYVNIHTSINGGGEIRGQILKH